ncbi:hypothetical protein DFS33DRAFT_1385410 [Desarmillaria ectypa]|nr:hypothetical protein DFS33DRAFT_1385410 [Desarmillaria ectypa]
MTTKAAVTHFLQFRIQYSSIALLYYDYALTFPTEVKYVWGSKLRLSTVLYVCCRYALVANVLYLLAIAKKLGARFYFGRGNNSLSDSWQHFSCDTWYKIIGVLSVFGRAAVIVTFTGRTYAIFARSKIILIYLVAIGLACVILDIVSRIYYQHHIYVETGSDRCMFQDSDVLVLRVILLDTTNIFAAANLLLSILMVVFEYSSAILMMIRSIQAFKVGRFYRYSAPINAILTARTYMTKHVDSVVSLFTTAAVILNSVAPAGFFQRLLNALTLPLSGLLTARFLLHLRVWEHQHSAAVISENRGIASQQARTMEFRALSVVDEFGEDPVSTVGRRDEYALEERPGNTFQENTPSTSSTAPGGQMSPSTAYTESSR